ncbi:MAG: hypothetical protein CL927_10270 [Deltaproteobacteria bacterium]|nr:hypothetical protein [Deltaproteobacteria bacterium]HCH66428.1 hypothetical protein [Deltaproteobacteria bacterium]
MSNPWPLETLVGATLLAVVTGGTVATLVADDAFAPLDAPVLDGTWASEWEDRLDAGFGPRIWGIDFWGVVEWTVFRQGRPGVLVGTDDWLFTREEFEVLPGRDAEIASKRSRILAVQKQLMARNIQLVVALVPSKARIYSDRVSLPPTMDSTYGAFRESLLAEGVTAPDLVAPLRAARAQGEVFLATDTHWTPLGASVVAAALRSSVADWEPQDGAAWTIEAGEAIPHEGDLLSYVPLGPWQGVLGPGAETVSTRILTGTAPTGGGLLGDVEIPITVVGTSYSANITWGFVDELKAAFQSDALNAAQEGRGPIVPMEAWTNDASFLETPPRLVIWEIPERYLGRPDPQ